MRQLDEKKYYLFIFFDDKLKLMFGGYQRILDCSIVFFPVKIKSAHKSYFFVHFFDFLNGWKNYLVSTFSSFPPVSHG